MKVCATKLYPHPSYEAHIAMNLDTDSGGNVSMEELQETIKAYTLAPGSVMKDIQIPGSDENQTLRLHVIIPYNVPQNSPVILDIHGGGYVSGSPEIDNYRCIYLAEHVPCIVASVEYRLATRTNHYMDLIMDCRAAYLWLKSHAQELGGDPSRIALHGTSAGASLSAGLSLYLRDHGEPLPVMTVLNCPGLTPEVTRSKLMFGSLGFVCPTYFDEVDTIYMKPDGKPYSYYAAPAFCPDLKGLNPHFVVVAEYDPLRDEGLDYAVRLLAAKVPCEIVCAPRVTHGFCVIDAPLTRWVHDGICESLRREFARKKEEE